MKGGYRMSTSVRTIPSGNGKRDGHALAQGKTNFLSRKRPLAGNSRINNCEEKYSLPSKSASKRRTAASSQESGTDSGTSISGGNSGYSSSSSGDRSTGNSGTVSGGSQSESTGGVVSGGSGTPLALPNTGNAVPPPLPFSVGTAVPPPFPSLLLSSVNIGEPPRPFPASESAALGGPAEPQLASMSQIRSGGASPVPSWRASI